jgi:hypothetical protein
MEMNLASSDSEVEVIKILNKGLRLCPIRMIPCRRYEAKSCRDVATPVMTGTCHSRASRFSTVHPAGSEYDCV